MPQDPKFRILVVDDEPAVSLTYRLILEREGFEVVTALSAAEAHSVLTSRAIDLLICDLSLETRESGLEVIDFARVQQPGINCLLLTGYAAQDTAEHASEHNVPVLFKPVEIPQLLETIRNSLEKRHELRKANCC
jgi:NtrC-family two-component system response regulator AlgB